MDIRPVSNVFNSPISYQPCFVMPVMPIMPKLAHAYVPFQYINQIFTPMQGLEQGTIFPELARPYGVDPEYTVDE